MSSMQELVRSWADSDVSSSIKRMLESALFRSPEPQPTTIWKMIFDPPLPYWAILFAQACRIISLLILLPIFFVTALDFAGYAVFRTLGLHRRRVRIMRQPGMKSSAVRSSSVRRKTRIYQTDRHRPTDRSNIPSIVKAPLLSPGTYDAETLLRQRARSLSSASAEEQEAWIASGGQQARLSTLNKDASGAEADFTSADSDVQSLTDHDSPRDYFGRAPRVGVEGALGLADTDVEESGTESGRESPVRRFSQSKGGHAGTNHTRRRGLSGGLNFTPVSMEKQEPSSSLSSSKDVTSSPTMHKTARADGIDDGSVVSLGSSDSPSSNNGDRTSSKLSATSGSQMSSSWIGIDGEDATMPAAAPSMDSASAAAASELEADSAVWSHTTTASS